MIKIAQFTCCTVYPEEFRTHRCLTVPSWLHLGYTLLGKSGTGQELYKIFARGKVMDQEEAKRFLWGRGLHLEEGIVRQLVEVLPEILAREKGFSLRSFWYKPVGRSLMGKGSAYKIMKLFEKGDLDPYLHYLDANRDWHPSVGEQQFGGRVRGVLNRWLAGLGEDSLREVLRFVHFLGLLPEELMASAKELILPLECKITCPRGIGMSLILASNLHDMGHIDFQIENKFRLFGTTFPG